MHDTCSTTDSTSNTAPDPRTSRPIIVDTGGGDAVSLANGKSNESDMATKSNVLREVLLVLNGFCAVCSKQL